MSTNQRDHYIPPRTIDESESVSERLTDNAVNNILPARYLKKDENGNPTEGVEELFDRVAKNIALAELVYLDEDIYVNKTQVKPDHPRRDELIEEIFDNPDSLSRTLLTEDNVKHFSYDEVVDSGTCSSLAISHIKEVKEHFREMMEHLSFMPNSPTLMNAGDELQQLSACFVDSPSDDMEDIHETAKEASLIFQSGGGMGYAFHKLRPKGDRVGSTGGIASGPITFMETYDQMCRTVAQGGTRRGAQMGVMKVTHPDIIEFIHAKNKDVSLAHALMLNDPKDYTHSSFREALEEARTLIDEEGRVPEHLRNACEAHLSNFNISVGVTDGFMEALENGEEFTFINPRNNEPHIATEETEELWTTFGLGEYVEEGEVLRVPAEEVWEHIIEGAHENGEPGVIYLERANKQHSFDVEKHPEHRINATNPCGEQPLEEYEACNLGHINLSTIVEEDAPDWRRWPERLPDFEDWDTEEQVAEFLDEAIDWEELDNRVEWGTRFLDNVVTMSDFPIDEIEEKVSNMRKIGLGVMGLAQLYVQLGMKYGSNPANVAASQIMTHINHKSKETSHHLADARGKFGEWEDSKYAKPTLYPEWFEKQTGEDPEEWRGGYPIRNHNTTTIAPTGTTSMIGDTTSGCEPFHSVVYFKNVGQDIQGEDMLVEYDDYFFEVLQVNGIDPEAVKEEAVEQMRNNEFNGIEGLSRVPDDLAELFITTDKLSAKEHAAVQCACQDGVDSAISKTVNAPNDATLEDTDEAFRYVYEHGGKGVTYYRDGTRTKQVVTTRADNKESSDGMSEQEKKERIAELASELNSEVDSELLETQLPVSDVEADGGDACPECGTELEMQEGCESCPSCVYEKCEI